jgi:hypothetical protein
MEGRGSIPGGAKIFLFSTESRPALGPTQPHAIGTGALSPGIKRQGREDDRSPPSCAEAKNGGPIPAPPIRLHGVVFD